MPASFLSAAVAALSLSSMASAQMNFNSTTPRGTGAVGSGVAPSGTAAPTGGAFPMNNGSVPATPNNGGSGTGTVDYESAICPLYNDEVLLLDNNSQYLVACGTTAQGTVIAVRKAKRQSTTTEPVWLVDCVRQCEALAGCVGTAFNSEQDTCTFYSNIERTYPDPNVDLALVVQPDGGNSTTGGDSTTGPTTTVPVDGIAGGPATTVPMTTSTVYSTKLTTITSCAPSVTNCPARTVTDVISLYTTVCPVSGQTAATTGAPASSVGACSACAYTTSTATVFSCATSGSSISLVPVSTQAVVVPVLAAATPTSTPAAGVSGAAGSNSAQTTYSTITEKVTVTQVVTQYATVCPQVATAPGPVIPSTPVPAASDVPVASAPAAAPPAVAAPPSVDNFVGTAAPAPSAPAAYGNNGTVSYGNGTSPTMPTIAVYTGAAAKNAGMGVAAAVVGAAAFFL